MEEKKTWWNWLAIASFVLALVWGLLCIILIWLPLWVVCLVLALILGIAALCKKQTKRASILWIIISIFWMIIIFICSKFLLNLRNDHKDQIVTPVSEFAERVEANPNIAALMEDEKFSDIFEETLKQRFEEKYGEEFKNIESIDWLFDVRWDVFEEMKDVATTLAEKEWVNTLIPVNLEETPSEVNVCYEFYKTEEEITCTEQYEPVCGDNGQTYGNSCFACIEVDSYTNGECAVAEVE